MTVKGCFPGTSVSLRPRLHAAQLADGDDGEGLPHPHVHLARRHLVRVVVAGEPVTGVLVLALAPDLAALVRVGLVRADEVEAAARAAAELDDDVLLLPR